MADETRWLSDARFRDDVARGDNSETILERMADWCASRTTSEALAALDAAGLPAGPIYTPQQALDDRQVAAMGFLNSIADFPGLKQPVPVSGLPVELTLTPGRTPTRPPLLGEHTDGLLKELGYTESEVAALRADEII